MEAIASRFKESSLASRLEAIAIGLEAITNHEHAGFLPVTGVLMVQHSDEKV